MKLNYYDTINDMVKNNINEKEIWISSFIGNNGVKKNIRNVKPQIIIIKIEKLKERCYCEECYRYNDFYYSINFLQKIKKDKYKFIKSSLVKGSNLYDEEDQCKNEYDSSIYKQIKKLEEEKEKIILIMDKKIDELKKSFYNTDFLMEELSNN